MSEHQKANPVAQRLDSPPLVLSEDATFIDGSPVTAEAGGVVLADNQYYTIADRSMVPGGQPVRTTEAGLEVPANRAGRITILEHTTSIVTTYGAELEVARLHLDGSYADLSVKEQHEVNELYTFMDESGTPVTDSPAEFERHYWDMIEGMVGSAEEAGQLAAALATYGQEEPSLEQVNSSIYVIDVEEAMTMITGFQAYRVFRIGSGQGHTGISNTRAGIQAAEAMEYLAPILTPPTLAGTHINGGLAADLSGLQPTPTQQAHMNRARLVRDDLSGPYQSMRPLLRILGSPSAGIWLAPPPDTIEGYIEKGHELLENKKINNIDRLNGWHASRFRSVLDNKGRANTIEDCAGDTALGNPDTNVPLYLLRSGLTTTFEAMAMQGRDPRLAVASLLGTASMNRQARLDLAHRLNLRESARYGNDARLYRNKHPGEWLPFLLEIADDAPHTRLTAVHKQRLRGMYATRSETKNAIAQWCADNHTDTPTAQAYFDLSIGSASVYLQAHHEMLIQRGYTQEAATRETELGAAKALHLVSARQAA